MNLSLAQQFAVTEFIAKHFAGIRKRELNPQAAEQMEPGERHAAKFGGRLAAWVSVPQPTIRVQDPDALLAWCRKHLPMAIETVEQVRPDTVKRLTEQVKTHGGWVNPETGDLVPVDGIGASDPAPRVNLDKNAEQVIADAWRAGEIDLAGMLALEAAPEEGKAGGRAALRAPVAAGHRTEAPVGVHAAHAGAEGTLEGPRR